MAQLLIMTVPLLKKGVAYLRWGPLWQLRDESAGVGALSETTEAIVREYVRRRGLLLRVIPHVFQGEPAELDLRASWESIGLTEMVDVRAHRTIRVDLDPPLEELRKRLHPRWRNYLKASEKAGFEIVEGTDDELYVTFSEMYDELMRRKQFQTGVDIRKFRRVQQSLPEPLKMRVFIAKRDGIALNSLVVSHVGDTAIYLLAATTDEGLKSRGAHLLQWHAMNRLKEAGCRWYDLGGIDPDGNPGVYQFKSGLGGVEVYQLGRYELSGGVLSSLVVSLGERLKNSRRDSTTAP
jgi:lipid II:glycine glycyltransferase (peptidoglycan interpeptide bridge formation enzyme)